MPSACVCCSFCCTFAAVLLLAANKRSVIYLSRAPRTEHQLTHTNILTAYQ